MAKKAATATASVALTYGGYTFWSDSYRNQAEADATDFARDGSVVLKGVPPEKKSSMLKDLLPALEQHWRNSTPGYMSGDPATYPQNKKGRFHRQSYTRWGDHKGKIIRKVTAIIRFRRYSLFSVEYPYMDVWSLEKPQATVLSYLNRKLDGSFHFGEKTHWKLRLLMGGPLWLLQPKRIPKGITIEGEARSWIIPIWPTPQKSLGQPTPRAAHIDGGREGCYKAGLPSKHGASHHGMLEMLSNQIGFMLLYMNPEPIAKAQGTTGIYKGSHALVLECLNRRGQAKAGTLRFGNSVQALRDFGDQTPTLLEQPDVVEADKVILVHGATVHGTMYAQEMVHGVPRLLLNPKVFVARDQDGGDITERFAAALTKAGQDSLAYRCDIYLAQQSSQLATLKGTSVKGICFNAATTAKQGAHELFSCAQSLHEKDIPRPAQDYGRAARVRWGYVYATLQAFGRVL
ncbi:unnamed protein product [Chrysoparadoxa australica]